ncbi:MAG: peptidylprolyl isomerase [Anaerolineae bacterium]
MRYSRRLSPMIFVAVAALLIFVSACTTTPVPNPTDAEISTATPQPEPVDPAASATPVPSPTATTEPLAALVNGEPIPLAEYERQVGRYQASLVATGQNPDTEEGQAAVAQGRQWVLDVMIEQELIEQEAAKAGVVVTDEEIDATVSALQEEKGAEALDAWLAQEGLTLEEMRERLRGDMIATAMANRIAEAVPSRADHVHARHIVVATEEEARRILDQLQAGADFASLARTYSQDLSTRDLGGDLGFFPQGMLTSKEVEAAAFELQPGQLSEIVKSELGYHIVQVVERVPDQEIAQEDLVFMRDQAVREWLDQLRASADIQVFVTPEP